MKIWKNAFASFASLLILAIFLATPTGRLDAQNALPCTPNTLTFATYKPYIAHLNAGKSLFVRVYVVPPDLNASIIFDAFSLGEALRRSTSVGLIQLKKSNLTGQNCLKGTGKLVSLTASASVSNFNFEWTVQDNYPKILVPLANTVATHTLISGEVIFYKGDAGKQGVILSLQKL